MKQGVSLMVALFWLGYLCITLAAGFITTLLLSSTVWQLTVWGFASSGLLLLLPRWIDPSDSGRNSEKESHDSGSGPALLLAGLLLGAAAFVVHLLVVSRFSGPLRFERAQEVGVLAVLLFLARFLATSAMEEIGFRGYALRKLLDAFGPWKAVFLSSIAFGLSHLSYGWDLETILLGVVPCGMLWGMSALATGGLAMPIGLHAAWNFAGWITGSRAETGFLRMVMEEDARQGMPQIGNISYWTINGLLTLGFWLYYRRRKRTLLIMGAEPDPESNA